MHEREAEGALVETLEAAVGCAAAFRKDHHSPLRTEHPHGLADRARVGGLELHGESAQSADQPGQSRHVKKRVPCHEVHDQANRNPYHDGVGIGDMVRGDDQRSFRRDVLNALEADPPVEPGPEPDEGTESVQDGSAHGQSVPRRSR